MFFSFRSHDPSRLTAILNILLGAILIFFPGISGSVFCYALAVLSLAGAAMQLLSWHRLRGQGLPGTGALCAGAFFAVFGLICLFSPAAVLSILPLILGILLLLYGIGRIPAVIEAHRLGSGAFRILLVTTALAVIFGIVLIGNPFSAAKGVIMFFGFGLVVGGLGDLGSTLTR